MVRELHSNRGAGGSEATGHFVICRAGRRISGRMVVYEDDGMGSVTDCPPEDFRRISERFVPGSHKNLARMNKSLPMIEQDYADGFLGKHLHLRANQRKYLLGTSDGLIAEWLVGKASTELENGRQLCRFGRSDPGNLFQLFGGSTGQIPQTAETGYHFTTKFDGADTGSPGAEEDCQYLCVAQCPGASTEELFSRAIIFRDVLDQHEKRIDRAMTSLMTQSLFRSLGLSKITTLGFSPKS